MIKRIFKRSLLFVMLIILTVFFQNCGTGFEINSPLSGTFQQSSSQDANNAQVANGKLLFTTTCASCHNGPDSYTLGRSSKEDRTADQISAAISSVPTMNVSPALKALSTAQLQAISAYLKTPTAASCKADFKPDRTPLRLLSNTEYDNIAADLFLSKKRPTLEAKFEVPAFGSSGFSNTSLTSEATAPTITVGTAEKFWTAAGIIADEVLANKAQAGSAFSILAPCAVGAATVSETCYDSVVRNVTLKVWRRPVSESAANNEFARLRTLLKAGTFESGFNDFLKALLMSPHFLTVTFAPTTAVPGGSSFNLNDYQLATRMAFFLWQSTPDDALLAAAKAGTLSQTANLQAQILRMTKDPKVRRFAAVMTNEWLGVNQILNLGLTSVDNNTLNAMISESQRMFEDIISSDVSFLNSIAANYSFMNKSLTDYYGVAFSGADPNQFIKVSLAATPRRGIINQASFLMASAGAIDQTHPVLRGKYISQKIGCYDIAPPPTDIDTKPPASLPPNSTPAEMLAVHTQRAQCASCHNTLDPFGLPLESYDSRGIWRTNYLQIANRPIATAGSLPTGEKFSDTPSFMNALANSPNVRSCLVRKVMSAGLARRVASVEDQCNAAQIGATSMAPNSKFSDLILNIVTSRQFKMQTTELP